MLRVARKGFCSGFFSWGPNLHNLGRHCALEEEHSLPAAFDAALSAPATRIVAGLSESLILAENGQLFAHGHRAVLSGNAITPEVYATNVRDADVDVSHAVMLLGDGRVVLEAEGRRRTLGSFADARAVACGSEEAWVVCGGEGGDCLHAFPLANDGREFHRAHRLELLNAILHDSNARVVKLRLAKAAGAALLSDGALLTWGVNEHGNLGVPSSRLRLNPQQIYLPKEPLRAAELDCIAEDFALSVNVLTVLTTDRRVFFCGFEDVFLLREVHLPDGELPARVCAWESNFGVIAESGALFTRFPFDDDARPARFYADCGLYRVGTEYFAQRRVLELGGKYANAIARTA